MFGNKLTKVMGKVQGFISELQEGVELNNAKVLNNEDAIELLEATNIDLEIETKQARKFIKLLND